MGLGEILITLLAGIGQLVGIRAGTEQPPYEVLGRIGDAEIRRYAPQIAAETVVEGPVETARNEGFRRVAGYIFGDNTAKASVAMTAPVVQGREPSGGSQSIAMTAPVVQQPAGAGSWSIQFIMPSKYTMATLPQPNDPRVRLVEIPARTFAVVRFSGLGREDAVARHEKALDAALAGSSWRAVGEPVTWYYDPPWTVPFLRRNEVARPVEAVTSAPTQ
ncbi:heme-binding protein [Phenylobacterium sp.]|uniref:SOUL family heme-binding protein n=1 Tax=Phenylobacterium sp. TaxID=1871053 RepID=UPI0025D4E9EC|nr:heme-binding protein [Phenylobacterium sp.]MCA6285725.1 heme-binding protein [Phenylobacterium sp.]MCA6311600.1 heme-binding protein [Phenylobacterium sp.]MCA6324637.1 heme-binding protein [Phenylobacterium sp.]MCA6337755.1 heme-binding protein [Phenylobacterium sp.]MCA6340740.1 heme-binding protein [Phenylobacterium sp.]